MKVSEIETADYNPRVSLKPGDPEWDRLASIIDEYGMVEPLVWNERTNRLVGGHQRLQILKHQGHDTVDVSVVDLDEEREKALNVALNNPNAQSKWDPDKLVALAETMSADAIRLAGYDTMGDVHEVMRRHQLTTHGSFLSDMLGRDQPPSLPSYENPADAPDTGRPPAPAANGDDEEDDEPAARQVETDMKEPHKHLSGEQYFEVKLVFDGTQRDLWLRFCNRLKEEQGNDNTFQVLVQHAGEYLQQSDSRRIDAGADTGMDTL